MGAIGLLLPARASLTMISALGSYCGTAHLTSHTSSPHSFQPATLTRPDAVRARLCSGEPLPAARTGRRELGYSWMLVPFLLGPCERTRPWSLAFCDQDKGGRSTPRRRGRGSSLGKSSDSHTRFLPTLRVCGTSLETPRVAPGSRVEISSMRQKGRGAGPGRGGGRPEEQGVPRPGPGTALRGMGPGGDPPPLPRERAEHSPCRVRKSRPESMPDGRRGGRGAPRDTRPRRQRGGLGSERSVVEGPEWTAGGRRPEVGPGLRSAPRPPAPPPPGPSNPRLSPPLLGFGWEGRGGGLEARPSLAQACGRVPDRNSQIPLASSAAATHRPRALSLAPATGPHALPVGASPGYSDARKNLRWDQDR